MQNAWKIKYHDEWQNASHQIMIKKNYVYNSKVYRMYILISDKSTKEKSNFEYHRKSDMQETRSSQ